MNTTVCYGHGCARRQECLLYRGYHAMLPRIVRPEPSTCELFEPLGGASVRHPEDCYVGACDDLDPTGALMHGGAK